MLHSYFKVNGTTPVGFVDHNCRNFPDSTTFFTTGSPQKRFDVRPDSHMDSDSVRVGRRFLLCK